MRPSILTFTLLLGIAVISQAAPDSTTARAMPRPGVNTPSPANSALSIDALSDRIAVGEMGQLFIKVQNYNAVLPDQIAAQGLEIRFSGEQKSISIINGKKTAETTYVYRFQSDQPGTYTIPEFEVRLTGIGQDVIAKTRPIVITVTAAAEMPDPGSDDSQPYFAKLDLTRSSFYVNEIVPFTLTAFVKGRNSIHDVVSAKLEKESFVIKGFRKLRTEGTTIGDHYYSFATLPSHLFALKAGTQSLGPAEIALRAVDSSSGFGLSSLFQRTLTQEIQTPVVEVVVKPLPDNAPPSFTGGVGNFEMKGSPSTTTVGIGDPITMEFEVTGVGNLRTMGPPVFGDTPEGAWRSYEASKKIEDDEDSDGFQAGTVRFTQVILPEAAVKLTPEFQLSYFDPKGEAYHTLKVGPFPISLIATPPPAVGRSVASNVESQGDPLQQSIAEKPDASFSDVLHIRTTPPVWQANLASSQKRWLFWTIQGLLSIVFFSMVGIALARQFIAWRQEQSSTPQLPSFSKALRHLPKSGGTRHDFYKSVTEAVDAWRRENPRVKAPDLEIISHLSNTCDTYLYSGRTELNQPIPSEEINKLTALLRRLS